MRNLDNYLLPQAVPALFVTSVKEHYNGLSTDQLQRVYVFLWDSVFERGATMQPVARKIYEIEWQIVREILRERGVVA